MALDERKEQLLARHQPLEPLQHLKSHRRHADVEVHPFV
jgi:hypothetical protein